MLQTILFALVFAVHPPSNAHYAKTLSFPLIGVRQRVELHINSSKYATIAMSGVIKHSELLGYSVEREQKIIFELSEELNRVLRRYRCSITDARYDYKNDVAVVWINIGILRTNMAVRMPRT